MAVEKPLQMKDLHATVLHLLGLEHEALNFEVQGRLERLTGIAGGARIVHEAVAG